MKVLIVVFVLISNASSQTPPINHTTYESGSKHTDFRKCVWEKCSYSGCDCSYILNAEILKYDEDKVGACISREQLCWDSNICSELQGYSICVNMYDILYYIALYFSYPRIILRYTFWIIGFLVIAGNAYVIVSSFVRTSCFKQAWPSASLQCNHIVILNIAVADFIMGVYLITISIKLVMSNYDVQWPGTLGCAVLGSLVVISSEASCFLMVTLTSFRLFHVYRPLSSTTASSWSWKVCIVMCWCVAVFVGVFPVLNTSDYFVQGYEMENELGGVGISSKQQVERFFSTVADLGHSNCSNQGLKAELEYANRYFPQYAAHCEYEHCSKTDFSDQDCNIRLDILKVETDVFLSYTSIRKLGYYDFSDLCLPRFFVKRSTPSWEYSIGLLILNLTCFIFIAVSYILIYIRSTKNRPINSASTADLHKREKKMQKRIARIIITDFACWVPLCIICFCYFFIWYVDFDDIIEDIVVGFLLPINSALNPFLYSVKLSKLFQKLSCRPAKRCRN